MGVLSAISYRYFASFPCSIRSFLWKGTQFRAIFQAAKRGDSIFDHFYVNYPVSSLKTLNNNKKNEYKKRRERKKKETWVQKVKNTRNNWGTDSRETPEELSP